MGLKMRVLDPLRVIRALVDDLRLGKAGRDVAHTAVDVGKIFCPGRRMRDSAPLS